MNIVALIPARAGSKRIPGKNIKTLGGKPLIRWTVDAAIESGIFSEIVVSTDDPATAMACPSDVRIHVRQPEHATDDAPDILWVRDVLRDTACDAFAILRPTSPFRSAYTMRDALAFFNEHQPADSLRAVRFANEPPQKMWVLTLGSRMVPLLPFRHYMGGVPVPWHSSPTQSVPMFAVQTAAIEIAWKKTVSEQKSISGTSVLSYFSPEETLDINTPDDWDRAEAHAQTLLARVP